MTSIDASTYESWIGRQPSETFELLEMASSIAALIPRLCRTVTAFLNTSGGLIVVRLASEQHVGGLEAELYQALESEIAPRPALEVKVVRTSGVYPKVPDLLIVDVPVGLERPYSHRREILVRAGQSNQPADRSTVLRLIGESEDPDARWERQLLPSASEDDLDTDPIEECMQRSEVNGPMHKWRSFNDDSALWSLLSYLNLGARPFLRNSAMIVFGRSPTAFFPQAAIRAVAYDTDEARARELVDEKTYASNIFDNIRGCFTFLERNSFSPSRFPTLNDRSFQRGPAHALPFLAVREAILNAIVHRDFSKYDCNVTIKLAPDQIEIWNPGSFPEGTDLARLEDFRVSRPPNPDIANVLQRMGFIERLGSGVNRIIKAFEASGLPRPEWREVGGGVRLLLRFGSVPDRDIPRLAELLLSKLEVGEVMSAKRMATIGDLTLEITRLIVDYLCARGMLRQIDEDRFRVVHN